MRAFFSPQREAQDFLDVLPDPISGEGFNKLAGREREGCKDMRQFGLGLTGSFIVFTTAGVQNQSYGVAAAAATLATVAFWLALRGHQQQFFWHYVQQLELTKGLPTARAFLHAAQRIEP